MISWFTRRKRFTDTDEDRLLESIAALSRNEHFRVFVDHLGERRERSIRAMQMEKVVSSTNRHFMESGKLEAIDELLDDLEAMSKATLDSESM